MRVLPRGRTPVLIGLLVATGLLTMQLDSGNVAEAGVRSEPVADAGDDLQVVVGKTVVLDGSRSFHPSGKQLKFKWALLEVPPGSSARLHKKNSVQPSFTADTHGRYVIELTVHSGMKWSSTDTLTVSTAYPEGALVPVDTRPYVNPKYQDYLQSYSIQVGGTTYVAPPYAPGTETSTVTGFQVLVLDRSTLLPATGLPYPYTYNTSFSGTSVGYSAMIDFLSELEYLERSDLVVIISNLYDNHGLISDGPALSGLNIQTMALGGAGLFQLLLSYPDEAYSLIGSPGAVPGSAYEMCEWFFSSTTSIQGAFTKNEDGDFQFIYTDFTALETKSGADAGGNFSGSVMVGPAEIAAPLPGGALPPGQGALQRVSIFRDDLSVTYSKAYLTNVPGQESASVEDLVADLTSLVASSSDPAKYILVLQSIGVPFGPTSLYDQQSIQDLEKLINTLGGTEYAFDAIFRDPGTAGKPNKYSLLVVGPHEMDTMPTMPRLGPADESVEASTLDLQAEGSWSASGSDGNVRAVINKDKTGWYAPVLASKGAADVNLSLPIILFQETAPWITAPEGAGNTTGYAAAYHWISSYVYVAASLKLPQTGGATDSLRTLYPVIDNSWDSVFSTLEGVPMEQAVQAYLATHTDFSYDEYLFMRDQLITEVGKVRNVQTLFRDDISTFLSDMLGYQSFIMGDFYQGAYKALGIDPNADTTQNALAIVRLALDVASKAIPLLLLDPEPAVGGPPPGVTPSQTVGPILGIASSAVSAAMAFLPGETEKPVAGQITTTIGDLWTELYSNYLTETFVVEKSYQLAVSDWGKLQGAAELFQQWNQSYTVQAQKLMIAGFEASIYRVLIPIAYKVERLPGTQCHDLTDFQTCSPSLISHKCEHYGYHAGVPLPNYVTLPSQAWDPLQARRANDVYWVYSGNHTTWNIDYMPAETLNNIFAPFDPQDLTKLGVSKVDFFTRWPFHYSGCPLYDDWCYTCVDK